MNDFDPFIRTTGTVATSLSLLNRVISGEQQAWGRLVELYSSLIYSRCRSSGLQQQEAADVIQNVFISVHRSLGSFQRDGRSQGFRRWLRTITRNAIADHFRGVQKRPGIGGGGTDMVQVLQNVPDPFADEDSLSLINQASGATVRKALEMIRIDYEDRTWQAFWRTTVEGERPVDVAHDLGLKPGTVRQARYKILARLREELEGLL